MSKQLSSTKAWSLEQPVFIANKKNNWIYLGQREVIFFFFLRKENSELILEGSGGGGQATLCHLPSFCLSLPILTSFPSLHIKSSASRSLVCHRNQKLLLSCLTSIQNYVKMHLPVSDAHLWSNQLTLEPHNPTWPLGCMGGLGGLGGCSVGDHYSSQYVSHAYFLARGNYVMP